MTIVVQYGGCICPVLLSDQSLQSAMEMATLCNHQQRLRKTTAVSGFGTQSQPDQTTSRSFQYDGAVDYGGYRYPFAR